MNKREVKIADLPIVDFDGDILRNMVTQVDSKERWGLHRVQLKSVFDWIKEQAEKDGLTVKMEGEKIMFIIK